MILRWTQQLLMAAFFLISACGIAVADEVKVEISTIYAKAEPTSIPEELTELKAELESGFSGYACFTLLEQHQLTLPLGENVELALPDKEGSTFVISYQGKSEDSQLLKLQVGLLDKLSAEVKASPDSTFFQAGLFYEDGILILAIRPSIAP